MKTGHSVKCVNFLLIMFIFAPGDSLLLLDRYATKETLVDAELIHPSNNSGAHLVSFTYLHVSCCD